EIAIGFMESSVRFNDDPVFTVCEYAEPRLVSTLAEVDDPIKYSPIIVTENSEPVAIVKSDGEKTVFAIHDVPSVNLHANTITEHLRLSRLLRQMGYERGVWTIGVDQLDEPFEPPTRLSSFVTPPEHRAQLQDTCWGWCSVPTDTSFDSVVENYRKLANGPSAHPIDMNSARFWG
ncbi:MAG TPA: hypothetical protein VIJ25_07455, partial [Methylococcales bacterium]